MNDQKPKIFLSYAHQDMGIAKRIYQDLKRYGFNLWFDTESLEVGQLWENAIINAIKENDYLIAVLSSNSMTKKGAVQKELKTALDIIDLLHEHAPYVLPVRIDNCPVKNRKLKENQWIDVFPESEYQNGLKNIVEVLSPGMFLLRIKPMELSDVDVNEMIHRHGFYEKSRNPDGKGFPHQYKAQEIDGDKVVIDEISGLMWQQSGSEDAMVSEETETWINELNQSRFAGFNDWRFPTLEEAMSLIEPEKKNGLHIDPIFNGKQKWIWTSDSFKGEPRATWFVFFNVGSCFWNNFLNDFYVRAVRSAQSPPTSALE